MPKKFSTQFTTTALYFFGTTLIEILTPGLFEKNLFKILESAEWRIPVKTNKTWSKLANMGTVELVTISRIH